MTNNGIISYGDNAVNTVTNSNNYNEIIDWAGLEKELNSVKNSTKFESVSKFVDQASDCAKKRSIGELVRCL